MSRMYFAFLIFCVSSVLIFAVYLRRTQNHIFYKYYLCKSEQNRLKQRLSKKHLQLESILNPAAVSETFEKFQEER